MTTDVTPVRGLDEIRTEVLFLADEVERLRAAHMEGDYSNTAITQRLAIQAVTEALRRAEDACRRGVNVLAGGPGCL